MAVIRNRTECFIVDKSGNGMMRQGKSIFLSLVLVFGVAIAGAAASPLDGCSSVRAHFARLPPGAVLDAPTAGAVCGQDSCCSSKLEQNLTNVNKQQIEAFLKESISKLSSIIDVRARKFDGLFKEMMNTSKREFHSMFQRTYGKIYLQHSDLFIDFFNELETYYKKGSVRLTDTLDKFFGMLYQRMFTVINSRHSFSESYLMCVSEHMIELKPFGDVPSKLTSQLRRSFVATRTYYKALAAAADAAKKMQHIRMDEECEKELVRMQSCGLCKGMGMACARNCSKTVGRCMGSFVALGTDWDTFVDVIDKVAERLYGPYNIESVVEPLNIKISEAIMVFQENGAEVSKRIYKVCGNITTPSRRRRSANFKDLENDNTKYEIKVKKKKNKNKIKEEEESLTALERLIKEIRVKIKDSRQFWQALPYQYCNNASIALPPSAPECWQGDGGAAGGEAKVAAVSSQQSYNIRVLSDNLRKAYQGIPVEETLDETEESFDGSASGSGEGPEEEEEVEQPAVKEPETNDLEIEEAEEPRAGPETPEPSGADAVATMPLAKALLQYLLPIVLVWFGGAITDLL